ncbi:MAG: YXWGXW repeat-containing protein [Terracidiphilus sp.]
MKVLRSMRWMLLALLLAVIPASSYAGVFISVGFAPPVLPVYVQPPCPEPGWMWTPGYWAYGDDGYYWVPGTWVPSPYVGALWTPGYWGWGGGLYAWHPGYWGPHVGYYGGVNYGFGYMGIGFAGGLWVGGAFRYNTAVMHVNETVIHNTYVDNTIVRNTTIVNNTHVAYSGGPGGINHPATAQEAAYSREPHQSATSFQAQHETAARANVSNYASHNGGHPANAAVARPLTASAGARANIGSQSSGAGAGKVTYNASRPTSGYGNGNQGQAGMAIKTQRNPFEGSSNKNNAAASKGNNGQPHQQNQSHPQNQAHQPAPKEEHGHER